MHIMRAESPGPEVSKLVPRVKNTAIILYLIYFVMTAVQFVAYLIADMSVFDAINTAFATAGTGGFGIRNDSLASFTPCSRYSSRCLCFSSPSTSTPTISSLS